MKKTFPWLSIPFLIGIFVLGILSVGMKDIEKSEFENRTLQTFPKPTWETIKTGEYFKTFETYFADQFFARNTWLTMYTKYELGMDKTFVNDYHVTDDDWILSKPARVSDKGVQKTADRLNQFADDIHALGKEVYYYGLPHKIQLVRHLYPDYVDFIQNDVAKELIPKLTSLDGAEDLEPYFMESFSKEEREKMNFKTDHHWTVDAAYESFRWIMNDLNDKSTLVTNGTVNDSDFTFDEVNPTHFLGSWNRNLYKEIPEDEVVPLIEPKGAEGYQYFKGKKGGDLQAVEFRDIVGSKLGDDTLEYAGAYAFSLPHVKIVNPNAPNKSHILIIKDSYVNPMQVMFASQFETVEVVDNRYIKDTTAMELVKASEADMVVFMFNNTNISGSSFVFYE